MAGNRRLEAQPSIPSQAEPSRLRLLGTANGVTVGTSLNLSSLHFLLCEAARMRVATLRDWVRIP